MNGFNKTNKNGRAKFHKFHGYTAGEIKTYMPVNLEVCPETVVVAASGNGVPTGVKCNVPLQQMSSSQESCARSMGRNVSTFRVYFLDAPFTTSHGELNLTKFYEINVKQTVSPSWHIATSP